VAGSIDGTSAEDVPVHVHIECLTGDVLRSTLCGCGRALDEAMARFAAEGRGVVVYLRPAGGARACKLLEAAEDDADTGAAAAAAAWILTDLGVRPFATTAEPGPARLDEWVAARRRLSAAPRRIAG
jgi:3,4-dihydroxy 2-butanone 4-phosphate synthase/GTP cyclohydrolase II